MFGDISIVVELEEEGWRGIGVNQSSRIGEREALLAGWLSLGSELDKGVPERLGKRGLGVSLDESTVEALEEVGEEVGAGRSKKREATMLVLLLSLRLEGRLL